MPEWLSQPLVEKVLVAVAGLVVLQLLVRAAKRTLSRQIADPDARYRARKFASFLGLLLGLFFLSIVFADRLRGLNLSFGIIGAGVAFALQEVIASVAGWAAVSLGGFYGPGDRIQLGGIVGDVIDIGILRTTLMECGAWVDSDLYNGRVVRVANSFVFKAPLYNYSADFPFLWDEIRVPVTYASDLRQARLRLERIVGEVAGGAAGEAREAWTAMLRKFRLEAARLEPMVTMSADERWLTFTVRYVVDYKRRRLAKDELFRRIVAEFTGSAEVAIASDSHDVTLLAPPAQGAKFAGGQQQQSQAR